MYESGLIRQSAPGPFYRWDDKWARFAEARNVRAGGADPL